MRVEDKPEKYVVMNEHEWLEVASRLPRGHRLRAFCLDRARTTGQTWARFTPEEWGLIANAALAADLLSLDEAAAGETEGRP